MEFEIFFFKQKTAYEMRISDCSSDVCSSDLDPGVVGSQPGAPKDGVDIEASAVREDREAVASALCPRSDPLDSCRRHVAPLVAHARCPLAQDLRAGSATDRRSHGEDAMEPDAQDEPDEQSPAQEPVDPERDLAHVAAYERRLVAGLRRQDRQLSS